MPRPQDLPHLIHQPFGLTGFPRSHNSWMVMPTPNISKVMEEYARVAEQHALRQGVALDYSEASLAQVDNILETITAGGVLTPQTPDEQNDLWMLAKAYGGYVGQVVIRQIGGQWELQDLPTGGSQAVLRCSDVQAFPADKIYKRLSEDRFSGIGGYCRALRAIIAQRENKGTKDEA